MEANSESTVVLSAETPPTMSATAEAALLDLALHSSLLPTVEISFPTRPSAGAATASTVPTAGATTGAAILSTVPTTGAATPSTVATSSGTRGSLFIKRLTSESTYSTIDSEPYTSEIAGTAFVYAVGTARTRTCEPRHKAAAVMLENFMIQMGCFDVSVSRLLMREKSDRSEMTELVEKAKE